MKTQKFSLQQKLIAIIFATILVVFPLGEINSHSYTTGVDSFHYKCGCFGCYAAHLSVKCNFGKHHDNW